MDQFSSDNEHIGNGIAQKSFSIKTRVKSAHKQGMMHETIIRRNGLNKTQKELLSLKDQ